MAISKGHTFTANEEVDHSKLNNLVDNATISDGAITSGKIAGSAVTSAKIAAGAISNTAISSTAGISLSKLESATDANPRVLIVGSDSKPAYQNVSGDATIDATGALTIAASAVETSMVADDAITQDKIANDSIGSDQIASNAVGASELADDAVDTAAIVDSAITAAKLASGSLAGSPRAPRRVQLTSTTTWTVPSGVAEIYVEMVGGGGGFGNNSRGGGGGAYVATHLDVTAGSTITFTVGSGGTTTHAAGGNTTFTHDSTTYTAGGAGWAAGHNAYGTGGVASGGEINVDGFGALNTDSGYPAFGPWPKYSWGSGGRTVNSGIYQGTSTLSTNGRGGAVLITY